MTTSIVVSRATCKTDSRCLRAFSLPVFSRRGVADLTRHLCSHSVMHTCFPLALAPAFLLALLVVAAPLVGCSHQDRMKPIINFYEMGDYAAASKEIVPLLKDRRDSEKDRTIYELEAGAIYAASGELALSIQSFGHADERMWKYLDEEPEVRISEQAAAILTNQTVVTYRGRAHDRIMCTTYQALNQLAEGNLESAGVSLRRAYEWQRDAVENNAKEIEALEAKSKAASEEKSYDAQAALDDEGVKTGLESEYGPIREMKGYAEFAIPYSTYLQALQHQLTGRADALAQATVEFRRVAGMLSETDRIYAEADAQLAEAAATGAPIPPMVYVFFETGMAPWLKEFRLDIPLFMRQVPYVGAAFPVLKFNEGAVTGFTVRAGTQSYASSLLTDMDRVIADDFNRRLPAIITLTIVSSATKAIATYFAQQAAYQQNPNAAIFVAIAAAAYQIGTNSADLRTWLTLPKQVLYARFPAPNEGTIEIDLGDGQKIGPLAVESKGATIVHLRLPKAGVQTAVRSMRIPLE